jgi:hypothetical protein
MNEDQQPKSKLPFPQRDIVTSNQITNLIHIGGFALRALEGATNFISNPDNPQLDGGCKMAAESTFIRTMGLLDEILADSDRWSFKIQNSLEKNLELMYIQNTQLIAEQTKAAAQISLPHFIYRPSLIKLPISGEWVAHLGPLEDIERSIVGIGPTPKQALEVFDSMFTGGPLPDHIISWLAERELKENKSKPKNPKSKKKI